MPGHVSELERCRCIRQDQCLNGIDLKAIVPACTELRLGRLHNRAHVRVSEGAAMGVFSDF